eukprot:TRINITY_DN5828_c0_g1_i1.p1 TRINITY_DN5828_c0_g1~~TRINITY_DN5828_c0_g1_i1.p1  ORF type:complete len:232 (+),score=56.70 TRINITY_DN5828_c0_g1_i1:162-857(+)
MFEIAKISPEGDTAASESESESAEPGVPVAESLTVLSSGSTAPSSSSTTAKPVHRALVSLELKRPQLGPAASKRRIFSPALAAYRAANAAMRSSARRIQTDRLPDGHSKKVESLHTLTLFYLAQLYQKLNKINLSGRCCRATLERQLKFEEYDPVDWGMNAIQLGAYFSYKAAWVDACQCLLAAERSFARAAKAKPASVEPVLHANLAIGKRSSSERSSVRGFSVSGDSGT